jgi:hypothetical protein
MADNQERRTKMEKHTPGPWTFEKRASGGLGSVHYAVKTAYKTPDAPWSPRFIVWACGSLGETLPNRFPDDYRDDPFIEADVRLISAAPALLEALNRMLVSFAGKDEELCMECGEKQGTGESCDTCYVVGKAVEAVRMATFGNAEGR